MRSMSRRKHPHDTRNAHGQTAWNRVIVPAGFALSVQEHAGARRCGSRFAPIIGTQYRSVGHDEIGSPTDAGRLRLHEREHQLRGDRRIHGRSAISEHGKPGLRGGGLGRDDKVMLRKLSRARRGRGMACERRQTA